LFEIYYNCGGDEVGLGEAVRKLERGAAGARRLDLEALLANRDSGKPHLLKPVSGPPGEPHALRIWLAGVTHGDSARLREIEAKQATGDAVNVYEQKYRECAGGGRPELFSKGDPDAVVGHGQVLTRPTDTQRLVPETELVSVYGVNKKGQLERLGYTGGNDATDNGIEAANPLNLPQAKNWAGGCASFGPVVVSADEYDDTEVVVSCEILRGGKRAGFKEGKTGQGHLNMPDKLFHLERSLFSRLPLPPRHLLVFFWGTPIVFAEKDLAGGLLAGDVVRMSFSGGIGVLENPVAAMPVTGQLAGLRK
jgi:fumarylacetoacetate (FAA) hydrolase family protein